MKKGRKEKVTFFSSPTSFLPPFRSRADNFLKAEVEKEPREPTNNLKRTDNACKIPRLYPALCL